MYTQNNDHLYNKNNNNTKSIFKIHENDVEELKIKTNSEKTA